MEHKFGGGWTERKLRTVGGYLQAYVTALKNTGYELVYIDAFAGTGQRVNPRSGELSQQSELLFDMPEEAARFSRGSVRIALDVNPPFSRYVFIERDQAKCDELHRMVTSEYARFADRVSIIQEDCNVVLQDLSCGSWAKRRGVLFLDPFGMQVKFETMRAIAETKAIDLWILFPHGIGVNRMLPRDGVIPPEWRPTLNEIFGTEAWEASFYQPSGQIDLEGIELPREKIATLDSLVKYYRNQLRSIFAYVHDRSLTLVNSKQSPMFSLCFAMGNKNIKAIRLATKFVRHLLKE